MELTGEIKTSLMREYTLCSNAIAFYEKAIKDFEQKYHFLTDTFLKNLKRARWVMMPISLTGMLLQSFSINGRRPNLFFAWPSSDQNIYRKY